MPGRPASSRPRRSSSMLVPTPKSGDGRAARRRARRHLRHRRPRGERPESSPRLRSVEITGSYAMTLDTSDGRLNARVTVRQPDDPQPGHRQHRHGAADGGRPDGHPAPRLDSHVRLGDDRGDPARRAGTRAWPTSRPRATRSPATTSSRSAPATTRPATTIEVRTTVETSPIGYVIGIGVLVVVAVGLFFVFQRYGRR